ncbi:MAG: hypothetical protein LQ346_008285 [Caloplaca aetnensis]|nr:MAG: hypothetical protein LQ346_008285 [Caloplaca aetnensis]
MTSDRSDATLNEATCEGKKDSLAFKRDEEKAKEGNEARAKGEPVDGEKVFEPNPIETVRIGGHRVTSHGSGRPMSLQQSKSYGDGHGFTCFSNEERDAERASTADRHAAGEVDGKTEEMDDRVDSFVQLGLRFFGRKPIYVVSFTFFVIWLIPCAVAPNIQTMLIARFLDGLAGSAFLSVAGGTIGDMFNRSQLQAPMMIYSASPFIGPPIGPIVADFINYFTSWRWTFYVLLIWSAAELVLIIIVIPETYHPVLLRRKAIAMRQETGDQRWRAPIEQHDLSIRQSIIQSIYRPFLLLTLEPMCLNLCLFSAVLLGVLYLFFGAFKVVFEENHHFNLWQVGLTFSGLLVGIIIAVASDPLWYCNYVRLVRNRESNGGAKGGAEPEYRRT